MEARYMNVLVLTDENFEREVSGAKKPVLVDFWMRGCAPCFLLTPTLEKLVQEFEEKIIFAKTNLNDIPLTSQKYGITVAPTIILFKEGKPVSGFIGLKPEEMIRAWLEENLLIQEVKEDSFFSTSAEASVVEEDESSSSATELSRSEGEESKLSSSPFAIARESEGEKEACLFNFAAARVYEEYAKKNGFFLNPNKKLVEGIVKGLLEREKKFGEKYCPCRKISGDTEEDKKIICPCIYHLEELEKEGKCLCGLFVKNIII